MAKIGQTLRKRGDSRVGSTSARPICRATISHQVIVFPCVSTHPHNEGVGNVSRGFIGAREGADEGIVEGSVDCFVTWRGAEVGLEDGIKVGSSE